MKELPKFYDDLDLTLQEIEYLLSRGVKDRKSSFHHTMLCTINNKTPESRTCLLYTSPSPRDKRQSRMPSSA